MIPSTILDTLSEDEMGFLLYFVNVTSPPLSHNVIYEINHLKFFRQDILVKKLLASFNLISEEGHSTFISMMAKFGVKVDIKKEVPPELPVSQSIIEPITVINEPTGSVEPIIKEENVSGSI